MKIHSRHTVLLTGWNLLLLLLYGSVYTLLHHTEHARQLQLQLATRKYQALLEQIINAPGLSVLYEQQQALQQQLVPHTVPGVQIQTLMKLPELYITSWQHEGSSLNIKMHITWTGTVQLLKVLAQHAPQWQPTQFTLRADQAHLFLTLTLVEQDAY
ncbi:hypothetical protein ACGVWS_05555 [Enterobacteriaceae bacterium LUAb1]